MPDGPTRRQRGGRRRARARPRQPLRRRCLDHAARVQRAAEHHHHDDGVAPRAPQLRSQPMSVTNVNSIVVPIDESDIAPARALRVEFAKFWSTAQGAPRDVYDEYIRATPAVIGVTARRAADEVPGPGWWSELEEPQPGRVILFLHGGAYGLGHAEAYRGLVSQIAIRARVPIFALEYPLAPEATVPVARDLALRTLERLAERFPSVAIAGDSAGGGLSLAT